MHLESSGSIKAEIVFYQQLRGGIQEGKTAAGAEAL